MCALCVCVFVGGTAIHICNRMDKEYTLRRRIQKTKEHNKLKSQGEKKSNFFFNNKTRPF